MCGLSRVCSFSSHKVQNLHDMSSEQVGLLVATPLRLCRAIKLRNLPLSTTRFLVLDEADKLLQEKEEETSFLKQIDTIVAACQQKNKRLVCFVSF